MQSFQMMKTTVTTVLLQKFTPPSKIIFCRMKEWTEWAMKLKKGYLKECTLKMEVVDSDN